jgi:phosphatidylserine/phosphatidylglycerophosphate/cardiolipin synthase-like enzyme/uncharacterized membrane protein YdjX (TVP38/TMEM64 family)
MTASIFQIGRNCHEIARATRVAFLVDADAYFRAFREAAERAHESIIILGWDFSAEMRIDYDADAKRENCSLGAFLNRLVKRRRTLHVHVLEWDYPMVFGTDREIPRRWGLGWRRHHRVHVRYDNTHPAGASHHQKIVVVDDAVAFCGGLDLTTRRWDTPEHRASEPRRVCADAPYAPFHDVMMAVEGPAARALGRVARQRWHAAVERNLPPVVAPHDPWPAALRADLTDLPIAIALTVPKGLLLAESRQIEQLYVDMIAAARRTIFIENQYFTARCVGEALKARLQERGGPEIVVVLRLMSHGWLEEHTMHVLRTTLIQTLRRADLEGRFHVYYAHVEGLPDGQCLDIHSKVMVVDDDWLRIGSSNLSNRSMGLDTECDLALEANGDADRRAAIRAFRDGLLAEHLGVERESVRAACDQSSSLSAAIARLAGGRRTLRPLDDLPVWSEPVKALAAVADLDEPVSVETLVGPAGTEADTTRRPLVRTIALVLIAAAALTGLWRYTPMAEILTPDAAIAFARTLAASPWTPFVVVAAYTPASVIMFPRALITLAAVMAFGPWLGFAYAMTGVLLAAAIAYGVGRRARPGRVRRWTGARLHRLLIVLKNRGLLAVALLRLVPVAPFVVGSAVAGAVRFRLRDFLGGTALGMLPGTLAATVFADQLAAAIDDASRINYGLVAAVLIGLAGIAYAARRWLKRTGRVLGGADLTKSRTR